MKDSHSNKILILGGYGKAGKEIAELMAADDDFLITTAGRSAKKANRHLKELKSRHPKGKFNAKVIDISNEELLIEQIGEIDLVIVATPLDYKSTENLIKAVLQSEKANYLDLSPSSEKHKAFEDNRNKIGSSEHTFVLDAGFDPGLPGILGRLATVQSDATKSIEIAAFYRDSDIPEAGISDILNHTQKSKIYKDYVWVNAPFWKMKFIRFPMNFGKVFCKPIMTDEIKSISQRYDLDNIIFYHGGINAVSNIIMILWQSILSYLLPEKAGISLFKWAINNYTRRPYGGCIIASSKRLKSNALISVGHENLYKATAIPVVATAYQILSDIKNKSQDYYLMSEFVEMGLFVNNMKKLGLEIKL